MSNPTPKKVESKETIQLDLIKRKAAWNKTLKRYLFAELIEQFSVKNNKST